MRFQPESSFPNPVLANFNDDYANGSFSLNLTCDFEVRSNVVKLNYKVVISEQWMEDMIASGEAICGIFVQCSATHFSDLIQLELNGESYSFSQGALNDRLEVTPLVWISSTEKIQISSSNLHREFGEGVDVSDRTIVALDDTSRFFIEPSGMPTEETIFQFKDLGDEPNKIEISLSDDDRVSIGLNSDLYKEINELSELGAHKVVLLNSIYTSAIMDVLSQLSNGNESYEDRTWYEVFRLRCDSVGIDLDKIADFNLLEAAQRILNFPLSKLYGKVVADE